MTTHNTNDVFGVRSSLIASYVDRHAVDKAFGDALRSGNEVIVYGSSKQGKTSLLLRHLDNTEYIKVECSPATQPIDIYKSALRQLGVRFIESETNEDKFEHGGKIAAGFKIKIPFFGEGSVSPEISDKAAKGSGQKLTYVEFNLSLAQDVSELLREHGRGKYFVLENFHYLKQEVQETLAFDLRVFQDQAIIFIILGIWREANRMVQFNGDLLDRITEIPVEPWTARDFHRVIEKGSGLLNVDFSEVENEVISCSFDSIGVLQEICKYACLEANVTETSSSVVKIERAHLAAAIDRKQSDYGVRHVKNFEAFADILRRTSSQSGKTALAFPYYFIKLLLTSDFDAIEQGIKRGVLLEQIRKMHHRADDVRSGDLGAFLHNITQHQITKKIQPPFVDYDRGGKVLKIIDSSLYFFLRHCDRQSILDDLDAPSENSDDSASSSVA